MPQSQQKNSEHLPNPKWDRFYTKVICDICKEKLFGQGTLNDPWRHGIKINVKRK